MNWRLIISTHHKTGAIWMTQTFRAIAKRLEIPANDYLDRASRGLELTPPRIINDKHGKWYRESRRAAEKLSGDRVFHLIRDPRDVVISGMHYHRQSREHWLHVPRDKFGGQTYQNTINSLPDDHARLIFEMDNKAAQTIDDMTNWPYGRPECFECKYESLIEDASMILFTRAVTHLGFEGDEVEICRKAFWQRSLFGGKKPAVHEGSGEVHIRSGKSRQWADVFDRRLRQAFVERFPGVLAKLGYEPNDDWASAEGKAVPHGAVED